MNNINLDNIKVAIFDFDNTLAIHKDKDFNKHRQESEDNYLNYYLQAYLNPDSFYENIEPCTKSDKLYKLITILKNKDIKVYCLSGMRFSFHLKAKQNFVNKYYGDDIEVISARNQETKVDAVKIISIINNCRMNEILYVDELEENISRLKDMDVHSLLPCEVDELLNSTK